MKTSGINQDSTHLSTMDHSEHAIIAQGLTRRFGDFTAVDKVSFSVKKGEVFGFLGPNGAGKSTTIRMLCGLLRPSEGTAHVAGINVAKASYMLKQRIGYMSQKFSLYGELTVGENIALYEGIYGSRQSDLRRAYLEIFGLDKKMHAMTSDLPTGWKQRLALLCAILHEPEVLFLDEPTAGVDPEARQAFWDIIYDLSSKGTTVLVTTHYMEEAEQCQRIGMIFNGKLAEKGTPKEIKEKIHGSLYEIEHPQTQKISEVLKGIPGIADISPFGKRLHILSTDPHLNAEIIAKNLIEKGLGKISIRSIPPSLEDAFIYLFERGN